MKTRIYLCILFGSMGLCAAASGQPGAAFPASDEAPAGMLAIDSQDDTIYPVRIQELTYVTRPEGEVKLKLISPSGSGDIFGQNSNRPAVPLVVYVQGSAWFYQDNSATIPRLSSFVEQSGYIVASVQYRPSTVATAPAQIEDVKSAIRYLRANAGRLGIDADNIAIWGDSSGGHMAAMTGTTNGLDDFITDDLKDVSAGVKAVVDFFGPTDFRNMSAFPSVLDHDAANSPESTVVGSPIQDAAASDGVALYNPISYISPDRKLPPFLIMHGDVDQLVPFNQSVILYQALLEAGQDVTFYKVKGAGHGTRFYTPAVMDIMTAFLDEHLKP